MRGVVIVILFVFLISCQTDPSVTVESLSEKPIITLGSKAFTEQYLLMKMSALILREEGFEVEEKRFLDSPSIRNGIENNVIDLYWEYTNTAKIIYHKEDAGYDPIEAYRDVKEEDAKKDLIWLEKSDFNSSWGLVVKKSFADSNNLKSVSDLVHYIKNDESSTLKLATNEEYLRREDGLGHLEKVYDFKIDENQLLAVDSELLSLAVKESRVELAVGMITDSRIQDYRLVILEDNRKAFPPYDAAPVVLKETLEKYPVIATKLNALSSIITNEKMVNLNYQVDVLHKDVGKVAKEFLVENHLIPASN